jgi:hypothetical protein
MELATLEKALLAFEPIRRNVPTTTTRIILRRYFSRSDCAAGGQSRANQFGRTPRQKHFYRFGALGSPDIICVIEGQFVGIEVKAPKGKQSEHQKEFRKKLEAAGGKYLLTYSLDDVIDGLNKIH